MSHFQFLRSSKNGITYCKSTRYVVVDKLRLKLSLVNREALLSKSFQTSMSSCNNYLNFQMTKESEKIFRTVYSYMPSFDTRVFLNKVK